MHGQHNIKKSVRSYDHYSHLQTERLGDSKPLKVKVKVTLEQATKVRRGSKVIALLFV